MKDDNRRKALKVLAVGAPAVWAKPVVDSVALPAHGATSCGCEVISPGSLEYVQDATDPFGYGRVLFYGGTNDCIEENATDTGSVEVVEASNPSEAEARYESAFSPCDVGGEDEMRQLSGITCVAVWTCQEID